MPRYVRGDVPLNLLHYLCPSDFCQCFVTDTANTQTSQTVKTGDSVTLHTNLEAIPEDVFIRWFYGPNEALIAEVSKDHISMCVLEELKGRLLVDSQTGDLTITNTSTTDSGIFKLQINKEFRECWSFNVTVIGK